MSTVPPRATSRPRMSAEDIKRNAVYLRDKLEPKYHHFFDHLCEQASAVSETAPKCEDCGFTLTRGVLDRSGQEWSCAVCSKAGIRMSENKRLRAELEAARSARVTLAPNVAGRDFYELCQQYRHSKEMMPYGVPNTVQAFKNLQEYITTGKLPWPSYEDV